MQLPSSPSTSDAPSVVRYAAFDAITLDGPDAVRFAHAQLATDLEHADDGSAQWSAYLTAQGRTIVLAVVERRAPTTVVLHVPAARGAELAARLQRFVFRSKVKLAVSETPLAPSAVPLLAGAPDEETAFRSWLVDRAIPLLAGAAVESQTPHALGLDALDAVSTKKGCYPGQEIVARTHFLGRNKRHLVRYEGAASAIDGEAPIALPPGAPLTADGQAVAESILAVNDASGRVRGLAVAHEQAFGASPWRLPDGTPVTAAKVR